MTSNEKISKKFSSRAAAETAKTLEILRIRPDYSQSYEYFLKLAEDATPEAAEARTGRRAFLLLCVQVPLQLIHAAGFHPFKIFCGSNAACGAAAHGLPAIMCPMIRSVLGAAKLGSIGHSRSWILPTTCDWVVKFPEMLTNSGAADSHSAIHWVELPHLKDGNEGQDRWLDEIYRLRKFLEAKGGSFKRNALRESMKVYHDACRSLMRLAALRSEGRLSSVWFMLMAGTFFCDSPRDWTRAADAAAEAARDSRPSAGARVFLAGSPIFFPNFKLPFLLEETGLDAVDDDLCSSRRIFPSLAATSDSSDFGMTRALARCYHQGCICPTFIGNDRRMGSILASAERSPFRGVIFHVLKGCHPYDLESVGIEAKLKERGLKFLRLETDYSAEDSGNLLTRLEAFRNTLGGGWYGG
jgi:benzoyl-CoA reductase/2-hydroxyglutaryl-CoA dehydratase subunit BcrC/BadD/HgdB